MTRVRPPLVRFSAVAAALALVLGTWSPLSACGCPPKGAAVEACQSGCCSTKSLCDSCCSRGGSDEATNNCSTAGGCVCHPVSPPTAEQPRVPQNHQLSQAVLALPVAIVWLPDVFETSSLAAAVPRTLSGADLRVLYCSRLE